MVMPMLLGHWKPLLGQSTRHGPTLEWGGASSHAIEAPVIHWEVTINRSGIAVGCTAASLRSVGDCVGQASGVAKVADLLNHDTRR